MTHLKTTKARRSFVKRAVATATPKQVDKIYKATEKATDYYKK